MKKSFKYLMMAAVFAFGITSCGNDEDVNGTGPAETGTPASFSINITQPKTYASDHTDNNATASEKEIKTIDVLVFKSSGIFEKHQTLNISDFTEVNGVYTSTTAKVTATEGLKTIYVGINIPSAITEKIKTSGASVEQVVATAADLMGTGGFAMFSTKGETATLVAGSEPAVTVHVSRLLAKVIVKKGQSINEETIGGKILGLQFEIGNGNKKFFALPQTNNADPNYTAASTNLSDFYTGNAYVNINDYYANGTSASIVAARVKYALENTSDDIIQGQHTFATVKGTFVPKEFNTGAGYAPVANTGYTAGTAATFWTIEDSKRYYFDSEAAAKAWIDDTAVNTMGLTYTDINVYADGACYYHVYLNRENDYNVLRNNIYDVTISKVNGIGEPAPGSVDPTNPITQPTKLTIDIHVEEWTVVNQEEEIG